MSVWLEFFVKGGGTAALEASSIAGFMCAGEDPFTPGTPDKPVRVIFRAGESIDVIGVSVAGSIMRLIEARREYKATPGAIGHFDRMPEAERASGT